MKPHEYEEEEGQLRDVKNYRRRDHLTTNTSAHNDNNTGEGRSHRRICERKRGTAGGGGKRFIIMTHSSQDTRPGNTDGTGLWGSLQELVVLIC
jgi:hypothetical protein